MGPYQCDLCITVYALVYLLYLLNGFQESLSICDFVRNPGQNPFQRGGLLVQLLERLLSAAGTVLVT